MIRVCRDLGVPEPEFHEQDEDFMVTFRRSSVNVLLDQPDLLNDRLAVLDSLHSRETMSRWQEMVATNAWPALVRELLELHYDPLYRRSQKRNFGGYGSPATFSADDLSAAGIAGLAERIVHSRTAQIA